MVYPIKFCVCNIDIFSNYFFVNYFNYSKKKLAIPNLCRGFDFRCYLCSVYIKFTCETNKTSSLFAKSLLARIDFLVFTRFKIGSDSGTRNPDVGSL